MLKNISLITITMYVTIYYIYNIKHFHAITGAILVSGFKNLSVTKKCVFYTTFAKDEMQYNLFTYIHNWSLQHFSQISNLTSHTTYVYWVC